MKPSPLILIIEDQEDILELEEFHLQKAGFETMGFLSTRGVEQALVEEDVSLLVVDRNLPNVEGSEFVAMLRDEGWDIPVIFVSAKDQDDQVIEGFERGGDDYLKKPFNMNELVLRVKALLKRSGTQEANRLHHRDLTLDNEARKLYRDKSEIALTKLEFDLLAYLMQHSDKAISRDELLEKVWDDEGTKGAKSVNVAINRLKKKIETDSPYIEAVRGIGYRLC